MVKNVNQITDANTELCEEDYAVGLAGLGEEIVGNYKLPADKKPIYQMPVSNGKFSWSGVTRDTSGTQTVTGIGWNINGEPINGDPNVRGGGIENDITLNFGDGTTNTTVDIPTGTTFQVGSMEKGKANLCITTNAKLTNSGTLDINNGTVKYSGTVVNNSGTIKIKTGNEIVNDNGKFEGTAPIPYPNQ